MASRFPVTFFKRKIQTKLPGELPGVPSRFPVSFWLSKFWTRSSKFHFRALTGKIAASGNGNIMLYIYRFMPICRHGTLIKAYRFQASILVKPGSPPHPPWESLPACRVMKNRMDTNQIKIVTMLATIPREGAGGIPVQKMWNAILTS